MDDLIVAMSVLAGMAIFWSGTWIALMGIRAMLPEGKIKEWVDLLI